MKCEKCGKDLSYLYLDKFNYDGSDNFVKHYLEECLINAVVIETDSNWTGYELSEEEQKETIVCPYCNKFPFKKEEIQAYDVVKIVMFKTDKDKPNAK